MNDTLAVRYDWRLGPGEWASEELAALDAAGAALEAWLAPYTAGAQAGRAAIRRAWGGTAFHHANLIGRMLRRNHTEAGRIYFRGAWHTRGDPRYVPVHELAHVLDNRSRPATGSTRPWLLRDADMYGGGVADVMARRLGGTPERCPLRFFCRKPWAASYREPPLTAYGHLGPSEDFAETFVLAVLQPERLAPRSLRLAFMQELGCALAGEAGPGAEAPLRELVRRPLPRERSRRAGEGTETMIGELHDLKT